MQAVIQGVAEHSSGFGMGLKRVASEYFPNIVNFMNFTLLPVAFAVALATPAASQSPAPRQWDPAQVQAILDKTQTIRLAPSLAHLSPGERVAVTKLVEVGRIFQDVYEQQRHRGALAVRAALARRTDPQGRALYTLYRLNQGPIATTLDNKREPFPRRRRRAARQERLSLGSHQGGIRRLPRRPSGRARPTHRPALGGPPGGDGARSSAISPSFANIR